MSDNLIIYSSTDGHTKRICERISNFLKDKDQVKLVSLDEVTKLDLSNFKQIIIGASIRYGKHNPDVLNFVKKNINILNKTKTAFFSVNVVARKQEKNTTSTNPYVIKFMKQADWEPTNVGVFAGKVDYPSYRFFDKYIIKFIMWLTKGPTDVSQSYEFTDWNEVEKFGEVINKM